MTCRCPRFSRCCWRCAIAAGTLADRPRLNPPLTLGGYRVLAVDFHTHSSMWSDGALTPWGLVLEARRQGLDAFAITAHNETWDAHVGQRFSRLVGGPIVLVGEEIVRPSYPPDRRRHHDDRQLPCRAPRVR